MEAIINLIVTDLSICVSERKNVIIERKIEALI